MTTCNARNCRTYIGATKSFCRKHLDLLPRPFQKTLAMAEEDYGSANLVARAEARLVLNSARAEAADIIANKEREAAIKAQTKPTPKAELTAKP